MDVVIMIVIMVFLIGGTACGLIASSIMESKGLDKAKGFWIGLLLGVMGVVIVMSMSPSLEHQIREREAIEEALRKRRKERRGQ